MIHRHTSDPKAQHEAAERLGRMVADGQLSEESAAQVMGEIVRVAQEQAPNADASGLRMRLVHSATDARRDRLRARENALTAVRWAARPLVVAGATREAIMDAARKAAGDVLTDAELLPILADEWERAHGRRGRR